uniref:hypothetical protein n=1 Tax=Riemerella anatipestifer TaxID=34085 RepID=UPI0030BC95CF
VFWKCWKLSLKNFILRSSKSGGCQDDFFGLVSSFKLPHNGVGYWLKAGQKKPKLSINTNLNNLPFRFCKITKNIKRKADCG